MEEGSSRAAHEATRPRTCTAGYTELGAANANQQNGEGIVEVSTRESLAGPGRLTPAAKTMERRNSAPQGCYQRYMPMEVLKMPIPRKNKEKRGEANVLFYKINQISLKINNVTQTQMATVRKNPSLLSSPSSCSGYSHFSKSSPAT